MSRLLADGSLEPRTSALIALIETPEALEVYLLRAQSQANGRRRAQLCIEAVQQALRLSRDREGQW